MNYLSIKKSGLIFALTLLIGGAAVLNSCVKKDFDVPPIYIPHVGFAANSKIDTLNRMYTHPSATDSVKDTLGMKKILGNYIIEGVVSANDESGNIYKNLYIQNSTAGIVLALDQTNLYTTYKVGQRIFVKCKGMFLGQYGGVTEIGWPYNGAIGRVPSAYIAEHLFADSLPGKEPVADTLDVTSTNLVSKINKLVVVKNVNFPDAGQTFVTGAAITNRNIADATGAPIMLGGKNFILRTSNYASFSMDKLPYGVGQIRGILNSFNGQYQLYVRDITDLYKFDTTGIGPILTTIYENNFDVQPPDWVTFAKAGNNFTFDATYSVMVGNGYGGTAPDDAYLISPGIDLTSVSSPILTFKLWTKYTDTGLALPFEVLLSTNYSGSGDPTTATWTTINCTLPAANSAAWTGSGDVSLSAYHQKVYIAFHYKSSGTASATASKWEVDTFKVTGKQ